MAEKEAKVEPGLASEMAEAEKPAEEKKTADEGKGKETKKLEKKSSKEGKEEKIAKVGKGGQKLSVEDMIDSIKSLTVLELSQLVKALENEFGVSAAAPVVAAATLAEAAAGAEAPAEEEKTEFNVILKEAGTNRIAVIKAVRELSGLGLKESKDLVESAPKAVKEGVSKQEAATAKEKLEAAGATAEIT